MNTKPTLKLNQAVIDEAKDYAKSQQISLSKVVENYFNSISKKSKKKDNISPLVKSLTGIISPPADK